MNKENKRKKRRAVTLIEMIVVMLLIATITGALAYNYNASLTEGKAFKTRECISRIKTILSIALVENDTMSAQDIASDWKTFVKDSPMAGKGNDLLKDGWGQEYQISVHNGEDGEEIIVFSKSYEAHQTKKGNRGK